MTIPVSTKIEQQINGTEEKLKETEKKLKETEKKLKETEKKLKETEKKLSSVNLEIKELRGYYGENIIEVLRGISKNILKGYLNQVHGVNEMSKKSSAELVYLNTGSDTKEHPLYMDHILFNFMQQDVSKLTTILNYELQNNPQNLADSYARSVEHAENITASSKSKLWFINLKIPSTYSHSSSVQESRNNIFNIIERKKNNHKTTEIDIRRIHLFYDYFFDKKDHRLEQTKYLFTTLLLEAAYGIKGKILCIKNYDNFKSKLFDIKDPNAEKSLFLLDFGLYFSHDIDAAIEDNKKLNDNEKELATTEDRKFKKSYLNGKTNILCADFSVELPNLIEFSDKTTYTNEIDNLIENYRRDKVYDFDNPLIYSIFENYFLSLWNIEEYKNFLRELIGKYCKGNPEMECNCTNTCAFDELRDLCNIFEGNIQVMDIVEFWKECAKTHHQMETLIDFDLFAKNFSQSGVYKTHYNSNASLESKLQYITRNEAPKDMKTFDRYIEHLKI